MVGPKSEARGAQHWSGSAPQQAKKTGIPAVGQGILCRKLAGAKPRPRVIEGQSCPCATGINNFAFREFVWLGGSHFVVDRMDQFIL